MSKQSELWTWVHRANIDRYRRMLATPLTASQRETIERCIREEEDALYKGKIVGFLSVAHD